MWYFKASTPGHPSPPLPQRVRAPSTLTRVSRETPSRTILRLRLLTSHGSPTWLRQTPSLPQVSAQAATTPLALRVRHHLVSPQRQRRICLSALTQSMQHKNVNTKPSVVSALEKGNRQSDNTLRICLRALWVAAELSVTEMLLSTTKNLSHPARVRYS